ncbi:MAG: chromosome segregation protein SMC [Caldisericaceae bacterium]|nr:chromosome segregation protein SMC [Caldisericaceae bacterium]
MYLSRLQLLGFKSFAQKIKLDFNEGISCIIGPNGSGKSNIVDAVRWVLGEQRTTVLRSDKMQSVIFNGTRQRKPMGMAEVSLTIQNNKKILNTEFDEVVITRRLYRSGESEYLINNSVVRLKDILNLFMDTGLGPNSYSVIELKMVESILSENKAERRLLLEEAAGIVKYKIRRKSALKKLEDTRTDLVRINDIISEVEKKVNSLSRQVGKARRYLNYSEELKKLDIQLCLHRFHALLDEIRPLKQQLQEVSKQKEESYHQITIDEALLEDYKREQIKLEQEIQQYNLQISQLNDQLAKLNQDQAVAETRKEQLQQNKTRYIEDIDQAEQKIKLLKENLETYQTELKTIRHKKEEAEQKLAEIEAQRQSDLDVLQKEKQEIDQLNQTFRQKFQYVSNFKDQQAQREYRFRFQQEQMEETEEKITTWQLEIQQLETEIARIQTKQTELLSEQERIKAAIEQLEGKINQLTQQKNQLDQERRNLLGSLEEIRSRKKFFEQIVTSYEGFWQSTKYLMTHRQQFSGIKGTLSDIVSADENLKPLLETLLGDALNYILVDSVSSAKQIIEHVKKEKKGRITLIPLERVPAANPVSRTGDDFSFLIDQIHYEAPYRDLMYLLIGDVVLVDNLDQALQLANKYPQYRFITRTTETVNFNREISSGEESKKSVSMVGRKELLAKLEKKLKQTEAELEKVNQELQETEQQINQLNEQVRQNTQKLQQQQTEKIELDKKENQLQYEIKKLNQEIENGQKRMDDLRKENFSLKKEIENHSAQLDELQQELNELERETIQRTSEYERKSEAMESLLEEVQRARLQSNNMRNQYQNRLADIQRTEKSITELTAEIERKRNEIKNINETLTQIDIDSEQRKTAREKLWEQKDKLDDARQSIEQKYQELKAKIIDLEQQTREYRRKHDSTVEKSKQLELKIQENEYKAESIREYALKEYSEDVEVSIPYQDFDEQEAEQRIETLRLRIKNMGQVNPLAVQEYEEEKERFDFLTKQRDDLLQAEKSLIETIDKINKTARQQFMETFNQIKANFETVFKSFFENGEGTIELEEDADPLEADIIFKIRTKGKRLQTLTLLSSGEKTLTAISLLFSIYLVKPSPFCILDEVDAPLDDINIGRFTEALKKFSKNTQFIVVTHNKRTMEAAETLYGVTMEEEGVSKIVSVKFN